MKEKALCLFYISSEYKRCDYQQRSREYVKGCTGQGRHENKSRQVRRSSTSDDAVEDYSNLVFYSAFDWQPVQIQKKCGNIVVLGSLADKTSSTAEDRMNFVSTF